MDDAKTPSLNLEVTQTIHPESRDVIVQGLHDFNARYFGDYQRTDLDVYVRDADGQVVAGLIADYCMGWLAIHAVWVMEDLRGSGVGTSILKAAETAAIENGCRAAILDTLSFQAQGFYEKLGYVPIAVVDNYRGGAQKIYMQKRLR